MTRFLLAVWIVLTLLPLNAFAAGDPDVYFEESLDTKAPAGQPTMNGPVKTWIKGGLMRKDSLGRDIMIFRPDKGVAWMLHDQSRTYAEIPIDQVRGMTEKSLQVFSGPGGSNIASAGQWFLKTGQKKTVGKWNAYEIEIQGTQVLGPGVTSKTTQWISKDAGLDSSTLVRMFKISLGGTVSPEVQKLLDAVRSLDGYPVQQETVTEAQGQVVRSVMTLKKVEKKTLDASLFEIPFGYTKIKGPGPAGF